MDSFNERSSCPKCGCRQVGTRYRKYFFGDYIERRCGRCGYSWNEEPLDREASNLERE